MKKSISPLIRKFLIFNGAGKAVSLFFGVLVLCFAIGFYIFAWTEPSANPPSGNVDVPLNVSGTAQGKLGNLGVGISDPALIVSRLYVKGGQTWGSDLSIEAIGGSRWMLISTNVSATEGTGKFLIKDNNASAVRLTIDTSGNVGIGTTSPGEKLEVVGNLLLKPLAGVASRIRLWNATGTNETFIRDVGGSGVSALVFEPAGVEKVRIQSDGNVGIGTATITSPAKLQIDGDGSTILIPRKSTAGDPTGAVGMMYYNSSSSRFRCYQSTGWTNCIPTVGTYAPTNATYITQTDNITLTNEQFLSALASGYMKVTTGTGVVTSQAPPIPATDGGTGQTTYAIGDILYASAANTLSKLTIGSAGQVLTVSGGVPAWQAPAGGYWTLSGTSLYPNLTTYNLGVGTTTLDTNYKITTSGGGIKAESSILNQPAGYFSNPSGYALVTLSGNVGIGTTSPVEKLTLGDGGVIRTTRNAAGWIIKDARTDDTQPRGLYSGDGFSLLQLMTANTARMTIDGSGNVGIGTVSPGGKLDVYSDKDTWGGWHNAINFSEASHAALVYPTGGLLFGMHSNTNFYWANTTAGTYSMVLGNTGNLNLGTNTYISGSSGITYFNAGNVGIGTAGPNGKLDVYNSGANGDGAVFAPDITLDNNFTIQTYIDAAIGGGGWAGRTTYAGGCCNNLALQPDVGTVSIGGVSGNYSYKLNVNGTAYFSGTAYANGQALCQANGVNCPAASTNADTVDNYHASSFLINNTAGDYQIASNQNNSAYWAASLELRELNFGSVQTGAISEAPHLSFHWGGRVASQIIMPSDGSIQIRNNPGTGYETLKAGNIYMNDSIVCNASNNCGYTASSHSHNTLDPLSGDSNYKLAYTADGQRTNAGEWGRVVMRYAPNSQTYGVRVDRADYADSAGNADTVDGYHESAFVPRDRWWSSTYFGGDGNIYLNWRGQWLSAALDAKADSGHSHTGYMDIAANRLYDHYTGGGMYAYNGRLYNGWLSDSVSVAYANNAGFANSAGSAGSVSGYQNIAANRLYDHYTGGAMYAYNGRLYNGWLGDSVAVNYANHVAANSVGDSELMNSGSWNLTGSLTIGGGTVGISQYLFVGQYFNVGIFTTDSPGPTLCRRSYDNYVGLCTSLRENKENIADLNIGGLDTVLKLQPRVFDWKQPTASTSPSPYQVSTSPSPYHDLGFIAEEVEKINPLLASYDKGKLIGVKYDKITALLTKGIQEQQKQIEFLRDSLKDISLTSTGELEIVGDDSGNYTIKNKDNSIVTRIGAFAELAVAKIKSGVIETKKLIVDGVDILKRLEEQQKEIEQLKAEIQLLKGKGN